MPNVDLLPVALAAAPCGVVMCDESGRILFSNPTLQRMFGLSPDELLNASVDALVPGLLRATHERLRRGFRQEPDARAMAPGRIVEGQRKDGTVFPVEVGL